MIDVHCHLLPGIDDGAKDEAVSLAMLQRAESNSTTAIFATPHVIEGEWLPEWEEIVNSCTKLNTEAREAGISIPIYPGGEVAIHMDLLGRLTMPGSYCLNGGRYMLVELPATQIPRYTDEFLFTLQARGITPILAHPERHSKIIAQPELLLSWVNRGILLQVNAPSLVGRMGAKVMETAEFLLMSRLVHLVGSDAHSAGTRNPDLSVAKEKICSLMGEEYLQSVFYENPKKILNNEDITVAEVNHLCYPKKQRLHKIGAFFGF